MSNSVLDDAVNFNEVHEGIHKAAFKESRGSELEYRDIYAHLGALVEAALHDFWLELPRATPGMLPEEVEGHASDGQLYEVYASGEPVRGGMNYKVEIFKRLA